MKRSSKRLDKYFGGERGSADRMLAAMQKTYGPKDGQTVFEATVAKRKRRATTSRRPPPRPNRR